MTFVWSRRARHVRSIAVSVPVVQLATGAPLTKHRQGRAVPVSQVRSWGTLRASHLSRVVRSTFLMTVTAGWTTFPPMT